MIRPTIAPGDLAPGGVVYDVSSVVVSLLTSNEARLWRFATALTTRSLSSI